MSVDFSSFTVFPLYPVVDGKCTCRHGATCTTAGKHPSVPWARLKKGEQVDGPKGCSYGIATGERSGIIVVDTDMKETMNGEASLALLGGLPSTFTVATPTGGFHRYYKWPGFRVRNSASELGPGIDIRGDGGFVVAPYSKHRNGGTYTVLKNIEIATLDWVLA